MAELTFESTKKQVEELVEKLKLAKKETDELVKLLTKDVKFNSTKANTEDLERLTKKVKELEKALIEKKKTDSDIKGLEEKLIALRKGELDQRIKLQAQVTAETAVKRKAFQETQKELTAFQKLSKARNQAQIDLKNGIVLYGETSKKVQVLTRKFNELDAGFSRINKLARDGRPDVGRYGLATEGLSKNLLGLGKNLIGGLGIVGGIQLFTSVLRDSAKTVIEFDKAQQNLKAILGTTKENFESLKVTILDLGKSTSFTATQVTTASIELAKLGFTSNQIKASLKGVLDGAVAMGVSIPESAELSAKTLNAFGLQASDTERVVSTLAASTNKSATDFQYLADSLPYAATAAKQLGYSVEQTTAFIGLLADNGLKASQSGTALRSIFIELSKRGLTLDEALSDINSSTNKSKRSFEIFGEVASGAGVILAENKHKFNDLTTAISNQEQALKDLIAVRTDTLSSDITKLSSAWEGFILSIEDGKGAIGGFFRSMIQGITTTVNGLTNLGARLEVFKTILTGGDITDLSYKTKKALLDFGVTEKGNKIQDVLNQKLATRNSLLSQFTKIIQSNSTEQEKNLLIQQKTEKIADSFERILRAEGESELDIQELKKIYLKDLFDEVKLIEKKKDLIKTVNNEESDGISKSIDSTEKKKKAERELTGAIEIQRKVVAEKTEILERGSRSEIEWNKEILKQEQAKLDALLKLGDEQEKQAEIIKDSSDDLDKLNKSYLEDVKEIKERNLKIEDENKQLLEKEIEELENRINIKKAYNEDVLELEIELIDLKRGLVEKENEDLKALREKGIEDLKNLVNSALDREIERARRHSDEKIALIEKQQQAGEKEQDRLKDRIAKGDKLAVKSFEAEKKLEMERTEMLRKEKDKQMRYELALGIVKALANGNGVNQNSMNNIAGLFPKVRAFKNGTKGKNDFQGGLMEVGEERREGIRTPDGRMFITPDQSTFLNMPKGTEVFKDLDTFSKEMFINLPPIPRQNAKNDAGLIELKQINKNLSNQKTSSPTVDYDPVLKVIKQQYREGNQIKTKKRFIG